MSGKELQNIERNIERLKEQLAGKRDTLTTIAPEEKYRIKQQIEDLRAEIRSFEQEKWDLIALMMPDLAITDAEAEPIIAEVVTESETILGQSSDGTSTAILNLLNQIIAKLNEPNQPAAAKLKAAVSTIPPFLSLTYEAELDTESTFRRYLPTFSRWLQGVKERLKK